MNRNTADVKGWLLFVKLNCETISLVTFRGTETKWLGGLQLISVPFKKCINNNKKAGDITPFANLFCPD